MVLLINSLSLTNANTSYCSSFQIVERLKKYFDILGGPATFIQVWYLANLF